MNFALPHTSPPSDLLIEPMVRGALIEDLGRAGDITTDLLIPDGQNARARLAARQPGTVSGLIAAALSFRLIDPDVRLVPHAPDGSTVAKGALIAEVEGSARALLTAERTALNFVGHLSGVATATHALVEQAGGTKARIVCTRKTTPGLRVLQKYAVRCGGGFNHRFGVDDAVLVKDNHIAAAGGLKEAVTRLRGRLGHMVVIEVEVDTLEQLKAALDLGVGTILLDNMNADMLRRAVDLNNGRAILEASGGITLETVRAIAETGVDYISSGAITHSAPNLDVGLDFI
jgi:nicotinate-nucleotide pyrophosphorylase (carboxylating)